MDVDKKLVGRRVRHLREAADLSQDQLAEKLGLSKNHISSIECGKSLLTTKRLLALCDVLGGTPDYLFDWGDHPGDRCDYHACEASIS